MNLSAGMVRGKATLLVGLQVAACVIAAEATVRIVNPQALVVPWQDEVDGITAPRPHASGRHYIPGTFDVSVSFNGQRFRGSREYSVVPAAGVHRIAALGDSFTMGYGADDEQSWPAQLERMLGETTQRPGDVGRVEVINAANGGTGTGEQALWYERWVKRFHPGVVVLAVTAGAVDFDASRNIFVGDALHGYAPRAVEDLKAADQKLRMIREAMDKVPGYSMLAQHSELLALTRNLGSKFLASMRSGATAGVAQAAPAPSEGGTGMNRLSDEVRWLDAKTRAEDARLLVVFVPSRWAVYGATRDPATGAAVRMGLTISSALTTTCATQGVPFVDLTDAMVAAARATPFELYYDGLDVHPNPAGYRALAHATAALVCSSTPSACEGREP